MDNADTTKYYGYGDRTVKFSAKSPNADASAVGPTFTSENTASQTYIKKQWHLCLCRALNDLYITKNQDYGDSFHKTFVEEGFAMARIRLTDKLERFKTLSRGATQQVKDEAMRDTLIDLANYALMTILEMDEADAQKVSENLRYRDAFKYGDEKQEDPGQ